MTNNNEIKKWRELWLDSINELTTIELQEKSWLRKIIISESPHWSYIEFISCYFDDLLYYDYSHFLKTEWITRQEYEVIKDWHNELSDYEPPKKDSHNDKAILIDPKWLSIIKKGEKAKGILMELIPDYEKEFLNGMNVYSDYKKVSSVERLTNIVKRKLKNN